MKQLSCHMDAPNLSEVGCENYIRAAVYGHFCTDSVDFLLTGVLARLSVPSAIRIQTGTPAAAIYNNQPEAKRP